MVLLKSLHRLFCLKNASRRRRDQTWRQSPFTSVTGNWLYSSPKKTQKRKRNPSDYTCTSLMGKELRDLWMRRVNRSCKLSFDEVSPVSYLTTVGNVPLHNEVTCLWNMNTKTGVRWKGIQTLTREDTFHMTRHLFRFIKLCPPSLGT